MQTLYNPEYPELGESVAKFRRMANRAGGLAKLPDETRKAYGNAVHAAFVRRNRSIARLVVPEPRINCASGTMLTGENRGEIGRAVAAQHRAKLLACPAQIRKARTDGEWQSMYEEAMKEKRKRVICARVEKCLRTPIESEISF